MSRAEELPIKRPNSPWDHWSTEALSTSRSAFMIQKSGSFDKSWYQGRGVYGGLTAAVILKSMMELEPERAPRSFTLHCAAPILEGDYQVSAQCERRGSRVSHLSARLYNGQVESQADDSPHLSKEALIDHDLSQRSPLSFGESLAFASASFGTPRNFKGDRPAENPPSAPPPHQVMELPLSTPMMPPFCQHFRYRFCWNALPYTRREDAVIGGWCELREEQEISYPYIAALLDSWAPAIFPTLDAPTRAASVDFSYHFLCSPAQLTELSVPFLYRGEVLSLYEGYAEERNWLWDAKGTPVATARQLYAIG